VTRYAAFLRGVMPTNAKMPDLVRAFEAAGFTDVRTILGSGNVLFSAKPAPVAALQRRAEAAMQETLGRVFLPFVRPVDALRTLLASDPWRGARVPAGAKRVVTFLREPPPGTLTLPPAIAGARIVSVRGTEAFTYYVRGAKSPEFMNLILRTFGKDQTTRTWETVEKAAR
jgi:uncharacterized protein (DUF1697 family)